MSSIFIFISRALELTLSIPKTLIFNFYYFPLSRAYRLPVWVSHNVYLSSLSGRVDLDEWRTGVVKIGFGNVGVFDKNRSRTIWRVSGLVHFKGKVHIGHGSKLGVRGELYFGANSSITAESTIIANSRVIIGEGCLISWDVLILDSDFHDIFDKTDMSAPINLNAPIEIGDRVWIGCRCTILKGVFIGEGIVIGAGSVISKNLTIHDSIYAGVPGRIIKEGVVWSE